MARQLIVKPVAEQLRKLNSQQPPFGKKPAALLHNVQKIRFQAGVYQYQCFPKERTVFGAANAEEIAVFCHIRQRYITAFRRKGHPQPRAIGIQQQVMRLAYFMQCLQLRPGINGAHFGGLGNIHHPGLYHMRCHGVLFQNGKHALRTHLALFIGDHQHLMAGGFDGAGFVHKDMAGGGADDRLVRAQRRRQGNQVGLGAAG